MLLNLCPEAPSLGVRKAAKALAAAVEELEARSRAQGRRQPARDPRPADLRLDRAWGAIDARLRSWAIFAVDDPDRESSTELMGRLFPTGLDFLTLPYLQQHAQSDRRLQIIDEEGLRQSLEELAGEPFVQELFEAHAAYGDALGITAPMEPAAAPVYVDESLKAVSGAISRYVLQVIAFADLHPDNVAAARRALTPIDVFRRAAARRASQGAQEEPLDVERGEGEYEVPPGAPISDVPVTENVA